VRLPLALTVLGCAFVGYATLGYGNDNDTYQMIAAGARWLRGSGYHPSRGTGSPVPELVLGWLAPRVGPFGTNLCSVALAIALLWLVSRWGRRLNLPDRTVALLVLAIGLQPVFLINAATSMDYLYALAAFGAGLAALANRKFITAACLLALAGASRFVYVPAIGAVYAVAFATLQGHRRRLLVSALLALLELVVAYFPAFHASGNSFAFMTFSEPLGLSVPRNAANAILGHLRFWGLAGLIYLVVLAAWSRGAPGPSRVERGDERFIPAALIVAGILFELAFVRLPAEPSYLLPTLPILAAIIAWRWRHNPRQCDRAYVGLIVFGLVHGVMQIQFYQSPSASRAPHLLTPRSLVSIGRVYARSESAYGETGIFLTDGVILGDISARPTVQASWTGWLSADR
jgi:hypothetical protein